MIASLLAAFIAIFAGHPQTFSGHALPGAVARHADSGHALPGVVVRPTKTASAHALAG